MRTALVLTRPMPVRIRRAGARLGLVALLLAGLAIAPREARADEFQAHIDKAGALAQAERYKDALAELQAAYALRQAPRLLYMRAKVLQRLGDARSALASYEGFLAAEPEADPRFRADAEAEAAKLRHILGMDVAPLAPHGVPGVPLPAGAGPQPFRGGPIAAEVPPGDVHYEMKTSAGLMAGGAVLFGSAYAAAIITGFHLPRAGQRQLLLGPALQHLPGRQHPGRLRHAAHPRPRAVHRGVRVP